MLAAVQGRERPWRRGAVRRGQSGRPAASLLPSAGKVRRQALLLVRRKLTVKLSTSGNNWLNRARRLDRTRSTSVQRHRGHRIGRHRMHAPSISAAITLTPVANSPWSRETPVIDAQPTSGCRGSGRSCRFSRSGFGGAANASSRPRGRTPVRDRRAPEFPCCVRHERARHAYRIAKKNRS